MGSAMVRISDHAREALREIAHAEQESMQPVLEKAVEQYRRRQFFDELDAAYVKLQEDPEAWRAIEDERRAWDATLGDGLDRGEGWGEDGAPEAKAKR
ncbi:MAG TPA: toxin-antitoxin system protein [Thermoanaerobaculia bacterium]|jgi:predicted transcriptional regulator|nr:toxin-antitoxin system protein [Thermoanaerobaculia bacterium]